MAFFARLAGTFSENAPLPLTNPVVAAQSKPMATIRIPLPPLTVPETTVPWATVGMASAVTTKTVVGSRAFTCTLWNHPNCKESGDGA